MSSTRRPRKKERREEDGVSSVVAAVLLFALFTTAGVLYSVNTLPGRIEGREAGHREQVVERLGALKAGLDALSATGDEGPVAVSVDLAPSPVPILQRGSATGSLSLEEDILLSGAFTDQRLLLADGVSLATPDEPVASTTLPDVAFLEALTLQLTTSSVGPGDEAWVQAVATDGGDSVTVRLTHAGDGTAGCRSNSPELRLTLTTTSPASSESWPLVCEVDDALPGYRLDLTTGPWGFPEAVATLVTPFDVTLTDGGVGAGAATATFAAAYADDDGDSQSVGSGEAASIPLDLAGSRLVSESSYLEHEDQAIGWELGALVVSQADGQAVLEPPGFELSVIDGVGRLEWTVAELSGTGARTGASSVGVRLEHGRTTDLLFTATGASIAISSPTAAAWRSFLADEALLGEATSYASVGGAGDMATLTLTTDTTVPLWRVHLRIVEARVAVG